MPGFLLHIGDTVQCTHAAPATLSTANTRVLVNGAPAVMASDLATVTGCPFTLPGPKPSPCVTVRWVAATRVFLGGRPAVVQVPGPGLGSCHSPEQAPQGVPVITAVQPRVAGM